MRPGSRDHRVRSSPLWRLLEYLRGELRGFADFSVPGDRRSAAFEELTWIWDELRWSYWDPGVTRRCVAGLERELLEVFEELDAGAARDAFRARVVRALGANDRPCYSTALLGIAFPGLSIGLDVPASVRELDAIRLMVRKERRLDAGARPPPARAGQDLPCGLLGRDGLFEVLARFYRRAGYRTPGAAPLGRPSRIVSLFATEIDAHDVALVERSLAALCLRVPRVYRPDVRAQAAGLAADFPSAFLLRLASRTDW